MNLEQTRTAVIAAYPGSAKWRTKVMKMAEAQLNAVYLRLKSQGKVQ